MSYCQIISGETRFNMVMQASRRISLRLVAVIGLCLIGACANQDSLQQVERSAEELYTDALNQATDGDIDLASEMFDEVERQHPYSKWATEAQLMSAWALYQSNNYDAAINALDRFVELNPAHESVDYAFYLKAVSYYEQIVDVERDAGKTLQAKEAFEALLKRFPNSEYSRDGQLKLDLTKSHLAGKEMAVGRFYLAREHYTAAIRRFTAVITTFDTTNQVPEALYRITEAYLALGIDDEAKRAGAVLQYNYPDSIWTERMLRLIDDPETNHDPALFERFMDRVTNLF
jgi:outer membrane protein assembly factor BamD